jgi:HK97 family phage major capsid protein
MDNRSLIQKADLALSDLITNGGYLKPTQALRFLRLLSKQSVLLGMCTFVPMKAPKQEVNKIALTQRILRPAREATALTQAERSKPDTSKVELDAQLFKAEIDLTDEQLEDNIEGGDFRQTVMDMMSEAIARDMEELAVSGDTTSPDPFLATLDGVLKQSAAHIVDAGGGRLNATVLGDLMKTLPAQYQRDTSVLNFLTSKSAELDYRATLQQRETVGGDQFLQENLPALYAGVQVTPIPLWPDNLGAQLNQTTVVYTQPKNIVVGVWRQIRIETFRDITAGVLKIVATVRFDAKVVDPLGTAKAINLHA